MSRIFPIGVHLALTLLIFFGFSLGKQHWSEVMDGPWVQWGGVGLTALLISFGVLRSFYLLTSAPGRQRKRGLGYLVGFGLPLIVIFAFFGIGQPMLQLSSDSLGRMGERDPEAIRKLLDQAQNQPDPVVRGRAAKALYQEWGIVSIWNGTPYQPTNADREFLKSAEDLQAKMLVTRDRSDALRQQMPWIFGIYLGSFVLISVIGLARYTYRRPGHELDAPDSI